MKNVIMIPLCVDSQKRAGENLKSKNKFDIYYKNACVSAISAKKQNPSFAVFFVSNIYPPEKYANILMKNNVEIKVIPYNYFLFDSNYAWSLAFYKLNVMYSFFSENEFDTCFVLDSDVFVIKPFDDMVSEAKDKILLLDLNEGPMNNDYNLFRSECCNFLNNTYYPIHYGGEFICTNRKNGQVFIEEALSIYRLMIKTGFVTKHGDEFITSISANKFPTIVKNAGHYVYRFWTGSYRLINKIYKYDELAILHVPAEKKYGMIRIYNRFNKEHSVSPKRAFNMLHLNAPSLLTLLKILYKKLAIKH